MRLLESQDSDTKANQLRSKDLPEGQEDIEDVLQYQSLLYVLEIISFTVISRHHDNALARHFRFEKTTELVARKYLLPIFCEDIERYVKDYNISLTSKVLRYKPYRDLQSLLVLTHGCENFSMNYVTGFLLSV